MKQMAQNLKKKGPLIGKLKQDLLRRQENLILQRQERLKNAPILETQKSSSRINSTPRRKGRGFKGELRNFTKAKGLEKSQMLLIRYSVSKLFHAIVKSGGKGVAERVMYRLFLWMDKRVPKINYTRTLEWKSSKKYRKRMAKTVYNPGPSLAVSGMKRARYVAISAWIYACIIKARPVIEAKVAGYRKREVVSPISTLKSIRLGVEWIMEGTKEGDVNFFQVKLFDELVKVLDNQGYASKKKYDSYLLCQKLTLKKKKIEWKVS